MIRSYSRESVVSVTAEFSVLGRAVGWAEQKNERSFVRCVGSVHEVLALRLPAR